MTCMEIAVNAANDLVRKYSTRNPEKIADEMSYSWRQIIRLHGRSLQEFEKNYGKTYKNKNVS